MTRFRKITAAVASVALLGAGGLSAAQAATTSESSTTSTTSTSGSARAAGKRHGGPMRAASIAAIAKTLGVTSAQLKAALDASRPAKPTGARPGRGAEMATALADGVDVDVDVDVAKVSEILDANRPAKRAA